MSEMQTVEVRFKGEKLAAVTIEHSVYTLYRVDDGSYFVHHDEGEAGAYLLTGLSAAVATGHLREGMSEFQVRRACPELVSAAGLD